MIAIVPPARPSRPSMMLAPEVVASRTRTANGTIQSPSVTVPSAGTRRLCTPATQ